MMRNWRLRRAARGAEGEGGVVRKPNLVSPPSSRRPHRVYQAADLRAVTLVVDATDDLGLVWGNRGQDIVLVKLVPGIAKLHPHIATGMHLITINNQAMEDAIQAREVCDAALPGDALTLLLWQPPSLAAANTTSTNKHSIAFKKRQAAALQQQQQVHYVTARVYKDNIDSKTGLTLTTTHGKTVRIARLNAPAPTHSLRVGMRLVAIENSAWFRC